MAHQRYTLPGERRPEGPDTLPLLIRQIRGAVRGRASVQNGGTYHRDHAEPRTPTVAVKNHIIIVTHFGENNKTEVRVVPIHSLSDASLAALTEDIRRIIANGAAIPRPRLQVSVPHSSAILPASPQPAPPSPSAPVVPKPVPAPQPKPQDPLPDGAREALRNLFALDPATDGTVARVRGASTHVNAYWYAWLLTHGYLFREGTQTCRVYWKPQPTTTKNAMPSSPPASPASPSPTTAPSSPRLPAPTPTTSVPALSEHVEDIILALEAFIETVEQAGCEVVLDGSGLILAEEAQKVLDAYTAALAKQYFRAVRKGKGEPITLVHVRKAEPPPTRSP